MNRLTRRFAAWTACFAILLAALAPSISHALYAAKGAAAPYGEAFPAAGTELSDMTGHDHGSAAPSPAKSDMADHHHASASQHTPADKSLHFEHCPFCSTHAASVGLAPAQTVILPIIAGATRFPPLFYQSPHQLFVWAAAQARAPPVHF